LLKGKKRGDGALGGRTMQGGKSPLVAGMLKKGNARTIRKCQKEKVELLLGIKGGGVVDVRPGQRGRKGCMKKKDLAVVRGGCRITEG